MELMETLIERRDSMFLTSSVRPVCSDVLILIVRGHLCSWLTENSENGSLSGASARGERMHTTNSDQCSTRMNRHSSEVFKHKWFTGGRCLAPGCSHLLRGNGCSWHPHPAEVAHEINQRAAFASVVLLSAFMLKPANL